MIPLSIFIISTVALGAFVALRVWERRRGMRIAANHRKRLDEATESLAHRLLHETPHKSRRMTSEAAHEALDRVARAGVKGTRFVEQRFLRLIDSVRGRRAIIHSDRPSSSFLTDIKEHKRVLRDDRDSQ